MATATDQVSGVPVAGHRCTPGARGGDDLSPILLGLWSSGHDGAGGDTTLTIYDVFGGGRFKGSIDLVGRHGGVSSTPIFGSALATGMPGAAILCFQTTFVDIQPGAGSAELFALSYVATITCGKRMRLRRTALVAEQGEANLNLVEPIYDEWDYEKL